MLLHSLAHQDRHCTVNQKNKAPKYSFYNWSQIADISQSITPHSRNGQRMTPTYKYILHRVDGYQIKLDNTTKNIGELGQFVARVVVQEPVLRTMQAIRVSQTLTFAQFSINQQVVMRRALAQLFSWGNNAELLECTEPISQTPVFHHLAISDTEDVDRHHRDWLASRMDTRESTLLRATKAHAGYHLVSLSQEILHGDFHIRESVEVQTEELARSLRQTCWHGVIDRIGGDELV